jgi:DNA polymerase III subunit gamma/tau
MTSQVFYRKWRPQRLSEVVGQEHVTRTLAHEVADGKIAHAYLFCGPRGTGKTSTGRILAKAANCLSPQDGEPCNTCEICVAINEGKLLDIIEIDAASNRGIDDIRDLKEKVNFTPSLARYKVYIIDEAHMITEAASNAFLKTLEEPPAHAIFVLATTEPHKMLSTILSRCQRFDFHRLSQAAMISKLEYICGKEEIDIENESLHMISKATTGSLRDAENLLEQLVAFYGHEIKLPQVRTTLGITEDLRIKELVTYMINRDITGGLKTINTVSDDSIDLRQFNRELVNYLRNLLLVKSGSESVVDISGEDMDDLILMSKTVSMDYLWKTIKLFSEIDFRMNNYSPLPLELALVEAVLSTQTEPEQPGTGPVKAPPSIAETKNVYTTSADDAKTEKVEKQEQSAPPEPKEPPVDVKPEAAEPVASVAPVESVEEAEPSAGDEVAVQEKIDAPPVDEPQIVEAEGEKEEGEEEQSQDIDYVRSQWKEFVNSMRGEGSKGNLDAFLRSACEPVEVSENTLVVGFYAQFHKDYIDDPKYRFLVEKKLKEFFNQPYKLRCVIVERKKETKSKSDSDSPLVKAALERGAKKIET